MSRKTSQERLRLSEVAPEKRVKPMELTDGSFEEEVLRTKPPVLVDFWGSWCPPCKVVEPVIAKLEKEYAGKVKVGKLNVDRNPVTASRYHIKGVPTFIIFQGGIPTTRQVGAMSGKQLRQMIDRTIESQRSPQCKHE